MEAAGPPAQESLDAITQGIRRETGEALAYVLVDQQAVLVNVPLQGERGDFAYIEELGDRLAERVDAAGVGEFDGNMIGKDLGILYLYGPDADRLWEAIEGVLHSVSLPAGAYVVKQYGPPGSPETQLRL
jgi:hypothetical protein